MNAAILARDSTTNPMSGLVSLVEKPQNLGIEWDAENRLIAVKQGTLRSEFTYDGQDRQVRIAEKQGLTMVLERRFLWCGTEKCEERNGIGSTVTKRLYDRGEHDATSGYFYTLDHLRSVREMIDSGTTVRARYDYDPFGRATKVSGNLDSALQFAGYFPHTVSELNLAVHRAYDPGLGRWMSEDPIGWEDGFNRYRYGWNDPVTLSDPLGLQAKPPRIIRPANRPDIPPPPKKPTTRKPASDDPGYYNYYCGETGTLVFFDESGPSRIGEWKKWKKWKYDFIDECEGSAPSGKVRAPKCNEFLNFQGPTIFFCCCCEADDPNKKCPG